MKIDTEFVVEAAPDVVWDYLLRTEDVVQCIPGAQITEKVSDDEYLGFVAVKLGPLALQLDGRAEISERDHDNTTLTITGKAKDKKGRGATDATVAAQVQRGEGSTTRVSIVSDLRVTGKIAQFGRGVMKDVSQRIAEEFARNLEERLAAEASPAPAERDAAESGAEASASASSPAPSPPPAAPAKAIGGLGLIFSALFRAIGRGIARIFKRGKS